MVGPWRQIKKSNIERKLAYLLSKLGYLKDSNAAAHSVYSDIFYAVIHQPARSKTNINIQD